MTLWLGTLSLNLHISYIGPWTYVDTWMGHFEATTPKPTRLEGNRQWLHHLGRCRPRLVAGNGEGLASRDRHGITGNAKQLKKSQHYTWEFGEAVLEGFVCGNRPIIVSGDDEDLAWRVPSGVWDAADLSEICAFALQR